MESLKLTVDLARINELIDEQPGRKQAIKDALNLDRMGIHRRLKGKQKLTASELLTVANICGVDATDLAKADEASA